MLRRMPHDDTNIADPEQRHVRLFRIGRNQALRIPRAFELDGNDVILRFPRNHSVSTLAPGGFDPQEIAKAIRQGRA